MIAPGFVRVSLFWFFVSFGFRSSLLRNFRILPGDTRLPICVPTLPRVTVILHTLHLTLAFCFAWTLTNKLLYFIFSTESSFVITTERSDHTMDSADASDLRHFLSNNNARMDCQEEHMLVTGRAVQALVAQVSKLTTQFQQMRAPTAPPLPPVPPLQRTPDINTSHVYPHQKQFFTKCSLFFSLQPLTFSTKMSKVAVVLTLLSGRAALWGTALWENRHPCCSSFHTLSEEMRQAFDRAVVGHEYCQLSVRHSGTCSCMVWLTGFRRTFLQWNYPLILMDSN